MAPKPSHPNYDCDEGYATNQKGLGEESENTESDYGQSQSPGASPVSSGAIISPPRRSGNEYRSTATSRPCPIYEWPKTDSKKEEDVDDDDAKDKADGDKGKEKEEDGKEAKPEETKDGDDEEEDKEKKAAE